MKKKVKHFKKQYKRHMKDMEKRARRPQPYLEDYKCYKPDVKQTAWVVSKVLEALLCECSFRYMIYDIMGYGYDAYMPIFEAGGMRITNGTFSEDEGEL